MAKKTRELTFNVKKSPYLYYDFVVEGERVGGSTGTADKKEAERIARAKWQEARDRAAERRKAGDRKDMPWGDGVASYLAYKGDYASRHLDIGRLNWLTERIGSGTYVSQITHKVLVDLCRMKRESGRWGDRSRGRVSDGTVHTTVTSVVSRVLTYLREECEVFLPSEPRYRKLSVGTNPRVAEMMVDMQVKVMLTANQDILNVMHFILETGFRRETALLRWEHVHLPEGIIRVRTKGGQFKEVPMSDRVRDILTSVKGHHPRHVFTFVAKRNFVWNGGRSGYKPGERYPMTGGYLIREWHNACRRAGIPVLNVHDLRKTHGARIVRETGCLLSASKSLGHADVSMTAKHYAHITERDVRRRVNEAASRTDERIAQLMREAEAPEAPATT